MNLSRRAIGVSLLSGVIIAFLVLMAWGLLNRSPVTERSGVTRIGKPAPEFTLPRLDGGELVLAYHIGQPLVINFWSSWCPPCEDEAPLLESTWRAYKDSDVMFVGVDIQDAEWDGRDFLERFDITYPNGLDNDGKVTVDYGVIGLPVTFFVNRQGIVERRWVGAIRESQLVAWVEELNADIAPSGDVEGENLEGFRKLK